MLSSSHINAGEFGIFGSVIGAIYGLVRGNAVKAKFDQINQRMQIMEDDLDRHFEANRAAQNNLKADY